MTLGDVLASRRTGNLDALRLGLAICVIVSHAWPLALGAGTTEPLQALTGRSLGGWAVGVFFFISGLLITASAQRDCGCRFWRARARRIFPGLGGALLVTLALAYAFGSTASAAETSAWFFRALTLVSIEHRLDGAFPTNPVPEVVNGPLWSLFHEVAAYVICAAFVAAGLTRRPWMVVALVAGASFLAAQHPFLPPRLATFAPLFAAFSWGIAAQVFRDQIALRWSSILCLLTIGALLPWPIAMGVTSAGLVLLALKLPEISLENDISYGMYIYGRPVAQYVLALLPGLSPWALAILSMLLTVPFAVLSWHLVERPVLLARRVEA